MKKRISTLFCALLCGGILSGCGLDFLRNGANQPQTSTEELIQEYLHDRYQEDFIVLNTYKSADGRTPFSYHLTANCVPVANPDCIFTAEADVGNSDALQFSDLYGQGILNQKAAALIDEKLASYFEEYHVTVDLKSESGIVLPDMDALTFDAYFRSVDPNYADHPERFRQISCYIAVNLDKALPATYEEEFDILFDTLADFSEELHLNAQMYVQMMDTDSLQIYLDWYTEHCNAMGTVEDYHFDLYHFAYDVQQHGYGIPLFDEKPFTKEDYVNKRIQKTADAENTGT